MRGGIHSKIPDWARPHRLAAKLNNSPDLRLYLLTDVCLLALFFYCYQEKEILFRIGFFPELADVLFLFAIVVRDSVCQILAGSHMSRTTTFQA